MHVPTDPRGPGKADKMSGEVEQGWGGRKKVAMGGVEQDGNGVLDVWWVQWQQ